MWLVDAASDNYITVLEAYTIIVWFTGYPDKCLVDIRYRSYQ